MTKAEVQNYQKKYNMEILRDPITHEAHGVMCENVPAIPELGKNRAKVRPRNVYMDMDGGMTMKRRVGVVQEIAGWVCGVAGAMCLACFVCSPHKFYLLIFALLDGCLSAYNFVMAHMLRDNHDADK